MRSRLLDVNPISSQRRLIRSFNLIARGRVSPGAHFTAPLGGDTQLCFHLQTRVEIMMNTTRRDAAGSSTLRAAAAGFETSRSHLEERRAQGEGKEGVKRSKAKQKQTRRRRNKEFDTNRRWKTETRAWKERENGGWRNLGSSRT